MERVARILVAVVCGFSAGLAIGPISLLMADVSDTLVRGWPWPAITSKYALRMLVSSVPSGINGAIGAVAAVLGSRRRLGVTVFPVVSHVVAGLWALTVEPSSFLLSQLIALMFTVVMWPAGRLGQLIGWALRNKNPEPDAV